MSGAAGAVLRADWPAPPGVTAFTTLRHGAGASRPPFDSFNLGLRSGDAAEAVLRNRAALTAGFDLPSAPRWLRQVHGTTVCRFDGPGAGPACPPAEEDASQAAEAAQRAEPEADAAISPARGVVLAILTADCLPVVLAARDGVEIAAAHAGWRGLAAGVLERTVAAMRTPPARLIAWLGPAAGPQAYEVDAEVRDAFLVRDPHAATAFRETRPGHWRADLYALARMRLAAVGIAAADIHGGGLCTISDPGRFFSYRRDGRTGRMATLAYRA